jgi:amidophosphoribosyltransferase
MPNTAISYAEGFAQATGLQFQKTWVQKVNPERTFILPTQALRIEACSKVYSVNKEIAGRVIYLVDDSIVRGNTMKAIIKQLRLMGVLKIHVRVGSPPVINPCVYGIDIPSSTELIAHGRSISDVSTIIEADTLKYLPVEQLCPSTACTRCFGGDMLW